MSDHRAMLPYIHPRRSYSPTLYVDDETPYSYHQRKRQEYLDNYFYRLHPHHAYWYENHRRQHARDYYTPRASLPRLRYPYEDVVADPRLETRFRYNRDMDHHCTYCRPPVKKLYPSMNYDEPPCPHCEHPMKERNDQVLAFPWTPQSYRPREDRDDLRLPIEDEPPPPVVLYPQSAPPMEDMKKGVKGNEPPYSAPPFPLLKPRMGLLSVRERRKAFRRRPGYLSALPEDDNPQDYISPRDSISNVGLQPYRSLLFHPSRLRPAHSSFSERYFPDVTRRAEPTPPPLGYIPRRRLEGQYVDIRNGLKYDYNVNYGDSGQVDSDRRVVR